MASACKPALMDSGYHWSQRIGHVLATDFARYEHDRHKCGDPGRAAIAAV
jgi:hypothetical protein